MLGLCAPSLIASVLVRNQFYLKDVPKDGLFPHVEPGISGGMQSLRWRIRGKRMDFIFLPPIMRVFIRAFSYAEMVPGQKNGVSARYRALAKLKEYLATLNQ